MPHARAPQSQRVAGSHRKARALKQPLDLGSGCDRIRCQKRRNDPPPDECQDRLSFEAQPPQVLTSRREQTRCFFPWEYSILNRAIERVNWNVSTTRETEIPPRCCRLVPRV